MIKNSTKNKTVFKNRFAPRLRAPALWRNQRIGLFGGSFNPAHDGHAHVADLALKKLHLDAVWWLVSPGNPLKDKKDMAPFAKRFKSTLSFTRHNPRFVSSDIETQMGTRYTRDTIVKLIRYFPTTHFVWIMGEDNVASIHKWSRWRDIFKHVHVAIFHRKNQKNSATKRRLSFHALNQLARFSVPSHKAGYVFKRLTRSCPRRWVLLHTKPNRQSSTAIRAKGGWLKSPRA